MSFDDATETVVRVRDASPDVDPYGDPVDPDAPPGELPIEGCLVAPATSKEPTERGRAGVVVGWTIYAPPGTDVVFTDQLRVRGVLCDVEGEVGAWLGTPGGVVINAARASG